MSDWTDYERARMLAEADDIRSYQAAAAEAAKRLQRAERWARFGETLTGWMGGLAIALLAVMAAHAIITASL